MDLITGDAISTAIADAGIWPLLIMLLPYLLVFRKRGAESKRKRLASVFQATAVYLVTLVAATVVSFGFADIYLVAAVVLIVVTAFALRGRLFPYALQCPECGKKHDLLSQDFLIVYAMDDNICDDCRKNA